MHYVVTVMSGNRKWFLADEIEAEGLPHLVLAWHRRHGKRFATYREAQAMMQALRARGVRAGVEQAGGER